jgi:hypothetical protein
MMTHLDDVNFDWLLKDMLTKPVVCDYERYKNRYYNHFHHAFFEENDEAGLALFVDLFIQNIQHYSKCDDDDSGWLYDTLTDLDPPEMFDIGEKVYLKNVELRKEIEAEMMKDVIIEKNQVKDVLKKNKDMLKQMKNILK